MDRSTNSEDSAIMNGQTRGYGAVPEPSDSTRLVEPELGYTELMRGSVPCPTCRGMGNVPKEQEGQLIALIPMKDKRLRPRRTYLWVCLAVFLSLTAAGLLVFFMFPRSVEMISSRPYLHPTGPVTVDVTREYVNFIVMNNVSITNNNYFDVKVRGMKMTVLYDTQVLEETSNSSVIDVPIRGQMEHYITANITLDSENQMGYMASTCKNPIRWAHEMLMIFEFTCTYEYLGHTEETSLQTYQFVSCYSPKTTPAPTTKPPTKPTTTKPTTTKPTTTKPTTHKNTTHKLTTPTHPQSTGS